MGRNRFRCVRTLRYIVSVVFLGGALVWRRMNYCWMTGRLRWCSVISWFEPSLLVIARFETSVTFRFVTIVRPTALPELTLTLAQGVFLFS